MAEPNEQSRNPASEQPAPDFRAELPHVESPPLSPGFEMTSEPIRERIAAPEPLAPMRAPFAAAPEINPGPGIQPERPVRAKLDMPHIKMPRLALPRFTISPRLRRTASLAATVMIAAGLGAAFGAAVNKRPVEMAPQRDAALIEDNATMQKSIARLTKELAALKTSVDNTAKDSRTQIAKLTDRLERPPETTGSISKPAVAVAAPPAAETTPIPQARPMIAQDRRPPLAQGWTIREIRNNVAWVEFRGDLYAAQPGTPLPGLGNVEAVRREGNQWVVVAAKGIITSSGESTAANMPRPKPFYPPYYRPY